MNSESNPPPNRGRLSAQISCTLTIGAWGLVILVWGWVLTRPRGTFHDQGGLMLTFIVLPVTFGLWCVGGPIALALGGRARKQLQSGEGSEGDRNLARVGVVLSRVMFWGGIGWVLLMLLLAR